MRWLSVLVVLLLSLGPPGLDASQLPETGEGLYAIGCAKCHGEDGRGGDLDNLGFDVPLPDLTDCSFATRETDADWIAVTHDGGPVRGFSTVMPAFGEAFDVEQIQQIIDFVQGFCRDDAWPRGELNLPRAMVTEKAYPEDELVWTTGIATDAPGAVVQEIVYERRFGARTQWELDLPLEGRQPEPGGAWDGGIGDIAFGLKRLLHHRLEQGTIVSVNGEVVLPTGDEEQGRGTGAFVLEPSLSLGQLLPADAFFQLQAGVELPVSGDGVENEAFWRLVLGKTWIQGAWGRTWTPMVEILGQADLSDGELGWDLLPQIQVSLNRRQHVLANVGLRLALDDRDRRQDVFVFYVLWDWFDGGFLDGW